MREAWAAAFADTARAYWTPERVQETFGDRHLALPPGESAVLLRALGLLHRDGSMPPAQVRKYRQINHMIAVLGPSLRELRERAPTVRFIDAACGASYLTTLIAWTFVHTEHHGVQVLGVDRNDALVQACTDRAALVELDDVLRYRAAWLADVDVDGMWRDAFGHAAQPDAIDAVVSLHACDTATDDAIALGMRVGATLIAVAPCCQAELAAAWARMAETDVDGAFAPVWHSPHLRRELAATTTDTLRMLLLRGAGYETTALEFVAPEHTPKNTLIRAMRRRDPDIDAMAAYVALRDATGGADIALASMLPPPVDAALRAADAAPPGRR